MKIYFPLSLNSVFSDEFNKYLIENDISISFEFDSYDSLPEDFSSGFLNNYDLIFIDLDNSHDDLLLNSNFLNLSSYVPVIFFSSKFDINLWNKSLESGVQEFLVKSETSLGVLFRSMISSLERNKLRRKFLESNKQLENFAYVASHDLREPLRKVINFGIRLKDKYSSCLGDKGIEYLEIMQDASLRMRGLLDALLDYSRVNTRDLNFVLVNLKDLINSIQSDFSEKIFETGALINLDIDDDLDFYVELDLFRNLIQNILSNAMKFRKPNFRASINISAEIDETNFVIIQISDNGIGFEAELRERIFDQFMRIHGRDSIYKGNGMGLATCKRIAERHGGTIRAESKLGEGSNFIVSVPRFQNSLSLVHP